MNEEKTVFLNDEKVPLANHKSLQSFLKQHAVEGPYAVALNETFVPKARHENTPLTAGDRIELVSPMSGG